MSTRIEQHGDVVVAVESATVTRPRLSWLWLLTGAAMVALLLLSVWLRAQDYPLAGSALLLVTLALHWYSRRWLPEDTFPRPRTRADRRAYQYLQILEVVGICVLLGVGFYLAEQRAPLLIAGGGLAAAAVLGSWVIERAFRRVLQRVADAEADSAP